MAQQQVIIPPDEQPKSPMKFLIIWFIVPFAIIVALFVLMSQL